MTSVVLLVAFALFFVVSAQSLARRDGVYFAYYFVLFVYTFFTQLVYVAYGDDFSSLIPGDAPITDEIFLKYQVFVFASFVGIFLVLLRGTKVGRILNTVQAPSDSIRFAFFVLFVLLYDAFLVWTYVYNYDTLSYENPDALKSNRLFARPFILFGVVFLALYATADRLKSDNFRRRACQILMGLTAGIVFLIAVRAGTRTVIAATTIGVLCYEALMAGTARRLFRPRLVLAAVGMFILLTAIATYRIEGAASAADLSKSVAGDLDFFVSTRLSLTAIIFGDYAGPSVMLLSSISDQIVIPGTGLAAVFFGSLPFGGFTGIQSVGFIVSRIVDPSLIDSWKGFGYYILAEGYNVVGWFGVVYNTVVIGYLLRLSRRFWNTPDRHYRAFVGALFGMQAITVIRGQSSEIIRAWYYVIIPGLFLLWLGCGLRVARPSRRRHVVLDDRARDVSAPK